MNNSMPINVTPLMEWTDKIKKNLNQKAVNNINVLVSTKKFNVL